MHRHITGIFKETRRRHARTNVPKESESRWNSDVIIWMPEYMKPIAILYWGLVRSLRDVYPSHVQYIFTHLSQYASYDIFFHTCMDEWCSKSLAQQYNYQKRSQRCHRLETKETFDWWPIRIDDKPQGKLDAIRQVSFELGSRAGRKSFVCTEIARQRFFVIWHLTFYLKKSDGITASCPSGIRSASPKPERSLAVLQITPSRSSVASDQTTLCARNDSNRNRRAEEPEPCA